MDPRTGEIIKGHVSLGSLRVRQDYLIAEGLLAPYEEGKPVPAAMEEMALARLRQLAAHEVGHTLGLAHNYIASTADRASVMDYPHPLIAIDKNNNLDLSNAYAVGIGEWDKVAITYGYGEFGTGGDEQQALDSILKKAMDRGLIFLSDQDARPQGSSHPLVHLWDNGTNAIDELEHILRVRSIALSNFSERNIRENMPMATLEEVLVPVYLLHRYQVEAAVKVLGGLRYTYAMRGDGQVVTAPVAAKEQRRALQSLLGTLTPATLKVPEEVLSLLPPRPMGYSPHRELFPSRTGLTFDALSPAEVASNHVLSLLLHPERAARLVEHHALDSGQPGLAEVLDAVLDRTWKSKQAPGYEGEIQRVVDNVALSQLLSLATAKNTLAQVRAITMLKLTELKDWADGQAKRTKDSEQRAHLMVTAQLISRFQEDPEKFVIPEPAVPPPGQPIGEDDGIDLW